MTQSIN